MRSEAERARIAAEGPFPRAQPEVARTHGATRWQVMFGPLVVWQKKTSLRAREGNRLPFEQLVDILWSRFSRQTQRVDARLSAWFLTSECLCWAFTLSVHRSPDSFILPGSVIFADLRWWCWGIISTNKGCLLKLLGFLC